MQQIAEPNATSQICCACCLILLTSSLAVSDVLYIAHVPPRVEPRATNTVLDPQRRFRKQLKVQQLKYITECSPT